ncbi:GNAT family N-acetyltransferase [Shewanella sp. GXUN23E]|uniref:GNAT family N-acetyltransferase n=1 Tax=Shewanella sp. GXUN23E TaxID=3422498 RepID=UPI003D7DBDF5
MNPLQPTTDAAQCRIARTTDAAAIAVLTAELGYHTTEAQTLGILTTLLGSQEHGVFVALWHDEVAGWLVIERRLTLETGWKAEITGLVVSEKCRRNGLAETLVRQAEDWCRHQGLEKLLVRSDVRRDASHRFYQAIGFTPTKVSQVYSKLLS